MASERIERARENHHADHLQHGQESSICFSTHWPSFIYVCVCVCVCVYIYIYIHICFIKYYTIYYIYIYKNAHFIICY